MELVIKIPKEDFERCKKRFQMRIDIMGNAIANGIPLPKGHGDLIDVDDLYTSCAVTNGTHGNDEAMKLLSYAPTIIKADKEESEES